VPTLRVEEITSLRDYTELLEGLMGGDTQLWYRGAGRSAATLIPGLYRHPTISDAGELIEMESKLIQRFRERSILYEERSPLQEEGLIPWQYLFLMQHYGVPTRLLDWTENPWIGLYFAVTGAKIHPTTLEAEEPACVWILNPGPWNAMSLTDISFPEEVLRLPDEALKPFAPNADPSYMRNTPVAMYGLHNSARIVAQRGVFTIFGDSTNPMEDHFSAGAHPDDTLVKALLPEDAVHSLQTSLLKIGITDSVVYPDLGGLAKDVKRQFGFRV
jgi:hypothetical protein